MTSEADSKAPDLSEIRPSLLPFDPAELTAVRVRPAAFAKLVDVSRQTVSMWAKKGIITLGPDGRLDPAVAARQVFERSDPAKLRARVFKTASMSMDALRAELTTARARIAEVEAELACEREFRARFTIHQDDLADHLYRLNEAIVVAFDVPIADAIGRLVDLEFYGTEPELDDLEPPEEDAPDIAFDADDLFADLPSLPDDIPDPT